MDSFHTFVDYVLYTKYFEYALAFGFMALFLLFYVLMHSPQPVRQAAAEARTPLEATEAHQVQGIVVPEDIYFHQGHTWARVEDDQTVSLGLDDFAQSLLGKIDGVQLPDIGQDLHQGANGWSLQADGRRIEMLSPVDGEVVEVNRNALEHPETINSDPYNKGWLLRVKSANIAQNLKNLIQDKLAKVWTETAVGVLAARSDAALGTVVADGALLKSGMARQLDPEHWDEICREFFLTN
ncbi:MAG: glycine cleavage system protein H [Candidatus Alcyoniella australis]|nr:glycine cleavage system protein H [Candidatus Alcyoniella australis]